MSEETITTVISTEEPIIQITENGVEGFEILCRLCANRSDHLIPIYSEEGITNDLADKMNLYLPIKVSKSDVLPLQCCFQCASTVLTWHELVIASVEADRRLKEVQSEVEKQIAEQSVQPGPSQEVEEHETEEDEEVIDDRKVLDPGNLSPFRQELKSEPDVLEKRRNKPIKFESSDGWIKTEYVLESDLSQFIDCEDGDVKLDPLDVREPSSSDSEDFDSEYTPGGNNKVHPCPECGKNFTKLFNLKKHLKHFHVKDESEVKVQKKREYRCDFCQLVVGKKDELRNHIELEHPEHYAQFSEKKVRKRSKIDQEAVNRAKVVVDSRTYYHCNECGKNLHSPYTYIWHNRIHTGERPFVCDLCGKQFRVSQGLVRHLRETHAGIKNFPCDLCGRMFATRRNVEEHRRIHTNERPYICDLCGKSFKQKASLFVHNRSHTDSFPFKCSYCNQGFRTRPPLLVHVTRHTGEKPYACDICGRCFRIKYELKRHRLIHSDEKPFSCTDCGLSFRQKRLIQDDIKSKEDSEILEIEYVSESEQLPEDSKLLCPYCNRQFKRKCDILRHTECCTVKTIHAPIICSKSKNKRARRKQNEILADYFCDICQKGFTRKYDMLKHRNSQHKTVPQTAKLEQVSSQRNAEILERCKVLSTDGKEYYKCQVCGKLIHTSYNFLRHQTIHTGVKPYFCHICGKNYRMSSTLNRHIKELHYRIKNYSCDTCGRKFAAKASLEDHKNIHTNVRPFSCDVCGKNFKQKSSLHIHKLFHSDVFRFTCSICGKKYRRARELKVHSWIHTGHRPYSCEICGSMFRLSQDLKRHGKIHNKLESANIQHNCVECGASFTKLRSLKIHKKAHQNVKEID